MNILNLANFSFFTVTKYTFNDSFICNYTNIPRPHYCMGYVYKGQGAFTFADEKVTVKEGDIIFVPQGSTYISTWQGSPAIEYISFHFSFENHNLFPRNRLIKIQKIALPELGSSFAKAYNEYSLSDTLSFSLIGLFYMIMNNVYPEIIYQKKEKIDSRIEGAIEYIEHHYNENIAVDTLANLCNMSISHFHASFKNQLGCSAIHYKHKVCIRKAELMLLDNDKYSIEEISDTLGFSSSNYFRTMFKKITGKNPSEYRKLTVE